MILGIPVSNKYCEITIRLGKWHWYSMAVVNCDWPKSTSSSLETQRREVEEASNLVLGLELVRPVPSWWYRTVGAKHSILPTVPPVLQSIPTFLEVLIRTCGKEATKLYFFFFQFITTELPEFCIITTSNSFCLFSLRGTDS